MDGEAPGDDATLAPQDPRAQARADAQRHAKASVSADPSLDASGSLDETAVAEGLGLAGLRAAAEQAARSEQPDRVGRFVILDRLGAGGMGVVYAAWDPNLDRRVALKLVRPELGSPDAQGRLLREAQAMAKLGHPNVVAVYEVGIQAARAESSAAPDAGSSPALDERDEGAEGGVWIAMEFVDGWTLRDWLEDDERRDGADWAAILAVFRAAGEGLAAAHAAGLVHRDFKPDNVLIGHADGRPRVADFGLVRPSGLDEAPHDEAPLEGPGGRGEAGEPGRSDPLGPERLGGESLDATTLTGLRSPSGQRTPSGGQRLSAPLTQAGALIGTPRYMAPEQFRRLPVDARTDQFAFCVALYEALYGAPPFSGARLYELAAAVTLGEPSPPPRDSPVPSRVARAILRGLARDPRDRFPDMHALLAELADDPPKRGWPVALVSLAIAGVAAVFAAGLAREQPIAVDPCAAGREQITASYGPAQRAAIAGRFEAIAPAFAATSLAAVDEGLEAWTSGWSDAYAGVCATRHEQSAELYDRRMGCLRQRRLELEGLVAVLSEPDAELVRDAPELIADLPQLDACADPDALTSIRPPPSEVAEAVAELRAALANVLAQIDAGHYAVVVDELGQLRERAEALAYAPLLAEVLLADSRARHGLGRERGAGLDELVRSYELALASGDDRQALAAAIEGIRREGVAPGPDHLILGRRWNSSAAALSQRLGQPADLEVERGVAFGRVLSLHVEIDEAIAVLEAAVELAERSFGPDSLLTARAELAAAGGLDDASRYAEAKVYLDRAIVSYERRLTPDHPLLYGPLSARLSLLRAAGELDEALAVGLRMQAIAERSYGPEHPRSLDALEQLAIVHDLRGDHRSALASFEAVLERTGDAGDSIVTVAGISTVNSVCFTRYKLGEYVEAKLACAKALAGAEQLLTPEHPILAVILNNFGLIARAEGEPAIGLDHDRRALAIAEASVGPEHVYTAYSLIGVGEGLLALGRRREAIEPLTRAVAIRTEIGDPGELGEAQCLLGRAQGGETGRELAGEGLVKLRAAGSNWGPQIAACAEFLGD